MATEQSSPGPGTNAAEERRKPARRVGLSRLDTAALLGVSASNIDRMNAAGKLPRPLRLGGALRWNRRELVAWLDHNAPIRREWQPVWDAIRKARYTTRGR